MSLLSPVSQDPTFQWNQRTARHLLNRAGFGIPPMAVERLAAMTPEAAVAAFVDYEHLPDVCPPPPKMPERKSYRYFRDLKETKGEIEERRQRNEYRREEKRVMVELQTWWLHCMCTTQRPLQEKLALFWHGHFATSAEKVQSPEDNLNLNQVFRHHGMDNFRELVRAVGKSPAMLRYLDQRQSRRRNPNENWARELMELFTLGIGNYTEQDIKEAARAFTGWTEEDGEYRYDARRHDPGMKVILGVRASFDGDQVINLIASQPACAKHICTKLWRYFAYDDPEPEVIAGLMETFRHHDGQIKPVLRQMFLSRAFYQDRAYFAQIKSPAQLVAGLMTQLDTQDDEHVRTLAVYAMRAMGQSLFYPPNVKGWDGGRAWVNTNTLLMRYNFSNFLVSGVVPEIRGEPGINMVRRQFLASAMGRGDNTDGDAMMAGDGGMMGAEEEEDEDAAAMPAGQDSMPRDVTTRTFYEKLNNERQRRRESRKLSPEKRREERKINRAMEVAPFDAREFFVQYDGLTSGEIVDSMARYFMGFDLEQSQHAKLSTVLGQGVGPQDPVPVKKMAEEDLRATVQLLLSTVEYQVC